MYRVRHLAPLVVLIFALLSSAFAATNNKPDKKPSEEKKLASEIDKILSDPEAARGFWGIYAVSIDTGKPLYAFNQGKLFTPASNTKLFTTAAVFGLIGPDYRFKTTVETMGTLDKYGRLNSFGGWRAGAWARRPSPRSSGRVSSSDAATSPEPRRS